MMVNSATVVSPSPSSQFNSPLQVADQTIAHEEILPLLRRYGLMPAFVREVVIDQAIADIKLTEAERETAIERFSQMNQLRSEEQCAAFMQQRGLTLDDVPTLALRDQKLQNFKLETWGNKIESHFLQRKNRLDRVLYSLIRTKEAGLAQELYFRIQDDGHPFADLARQYSEGQEAQTGGLIGPVELSVPHPALARVLSISQPGQLWPPTRVGDWFVVVRLEKFLPAKLDDATRQRLLDELFNTWLIEQVQTVLKPDQSDADGDQPQSLPADKSEEE
jgi:parvulin-like peptidyl-prolyl isomerase